MIFSVEDSDADFFFLEMALEQYPAPVQLQRAVNGEEAITTLRNWENSSDIPRPALIILDFNLPRANGLEILNVIKSQPSTRNIPVIIFTSGANPKMKEQAIALGAQDCLTKPMDFREMTSTLVEACSKYLRGFRTQAFET